MKLIEEAQKLIIKHENEVVYDRVYFDVEEHNNVEVKMFASIDGGPQIAKKVCKTKEEILSFIKEYNI